MNKEIQDVNPDVEMIGSLMHTVNCMEENMHDKTPTGVMIPTELFLQLARTVLQWAPAHMTEEDMAEAIAIHHEIENTVLLDVAKNDGAVH